MILIFFIVFIVIMGLGIGHSFSATTQANERYEAIAREWGFQFDRGGLVSIPCIHGCYKGFRVQVSHTSSSKSTEAYETYTLTFQKPLTPGYFRITPAGFFSRLMYKSLETGDLSFDDYFLVETVSFSRLLPLLDNEARGLMCNLHNLAYRGILKIEQYSIHFASTNQDIRRMIKFISSLAELMTAPVSPGERLYRNFFNDPEPLVRRKNLLVLLEKHQDWVEKSLTAALHHSDPGINAIACIRFPDRIPRGYLSALWRKSSPGIRMELAEAADSKMVEDLIRFFPPQEEELAIVMMKAFSRSGNTRVSPLLVKYLEKGTGKELSAAIEALGSCGQLTAVEPLMNVKSLLHKGAVRKAIAQIQDRDGSGESGMLSVTQEEQGALSLEEEEGSLSIKNQPS